MAVRMRLVLAFAIDSLLELVGNLTIQIVWQSALQIIRQIVRFQTRT